ncbi:MAG: RES family NAD+ phosphorylase [Bacteroidales bacterium]|nr:RES family NAD+ phosphorylase [Bacteroidales bacterium]
MIVFRLCKSKYAHDLSGRGAELAGGRWNSKGVPMIYTSESRALCTAEIVVHTPLGIIPLDYSLVSIEFPDDAVFEFQRPYLPENWKSIPHGNATQKLGDEFISNAEYLVLKVPSAIVEDEYNYLLNPNHQAIHNVKIIKIEAFEFDSRLFNRE